MQMKTALRISVIVIILGFMVMADIPQLPVQLVPDAEAIFGVRRRAFRRGVILGAAVEGTAGAAASYSATAQQQAARSSEVSTNQKLYALLQEKQIKADEVLVYKTSGRVRYLLGFYFNKLLPPEMNDSLTRHEGIRAVITDSGNVEEVTAVFGPSAEQRVVKGRKSKKKADLAILFYDGGSAPRS